MAARSTATRKKRKLVPRLQKVRRVPRVIGPITGKTLIGELVSKHPESVEILLSRGFHCIGCHASPFETLEQGAQVHGIGRSELERIVGEINAALLPKKGKGN